MKLWNCWNKFMFLNLQMQNNCFRLELLMIHCCTNSDLYIYGTISDVWHFASNSNTRLNMINNSSIEMFNTGPSPVKQPKIQAHSLYLVYKFFKVIHVHLSYYQVTWNDIIYDRKKFDYTVCIRITSGLICARINVISRIGWVT